jgi:hypothetical protein
MVPMKAATSSIETGEIRTGGSPTLAMFGRTHSMPPTKT